MKLYNSVFGRYWLIDFTDYDIAVILNKNNMSYQIKKQFSQKKYIMFFISKSINNQSANKLINVQINEQMVFFVNIRKNIKMMK